MNETINSILHRRSIRKYKDAPVSMADLEQIVQCGQYAATGMGRQPWHFTIVTGREFMDSITEANRAIMLASPVEHLRDMAASPDFDSWRGAPCAIVISGDADGMGDCAGAAQNMAVAAYSLGLGSCILGSFKICMETGERPDLVAKFGAPEGYVPYFALAVGYADESPEAAPRKDGSVSYL